MKKRLLATLVFLVFIPWSAFSFTGDSLVYLSELTFHSDFEKQVFTDYFTRKQPDFLSLFMAIDPDANRSLFEKNQQVYSTQVRTLHAELAKSKSNEKRIKAIYNTVHSSFLKKYELKNHFTDIFQTGQYNCVSATALYGMVFQELTIPYVIKETPSHVYLIAYPVSDKILVETTDPKQGYLVLNEKLKSSFVSNLKNSKLISESEYQSKTTDELFDTYYFSEETISLAKLVGIQYMNDALYKLDKEDARGAFVQLEKAYLFYPSDKIAYLLLTTGASVLEKSTYEDEASITYLSKLARYHKYGVTTNNIMSEFSRLTATHLVNAYHPDRYDTLYTRLSNAIRAEDLKKELAYHYNYERGRIAYNQGKYTDAVKFAGNAYAQRPGNADSQSLFVSAIGQSLRLQNDGVTLLNELRSYEATHTTLAQNSMFCGFLLNTCLLAAGQQFELGKSAEAEKYRLEFEKLYASRDNSLVNADIIGRVYSLTAVYYFRKGNDSKAKSVLERGLELAPNNYELLRRREMIR